MKKPDSFIAVWLFRYQHFNASAPFCLHFDEKLKLENSIFRTGLFHSVE
jgi:hypothetical protein